MLKKNIGGMNMGLLDFLFGTGSIAARPNGPSRKIDPFDVEGYEDEGYDDDYVGDGLDGPDERDDDDDNG